MHAIRTRVRFIRPFARVCLALALGCLASGVSSGGTGTVAVPGLHSSATIRDVPVNMTPQLAPVQTLNENWQPSGSFSLERPSDSELVVTQKVPKVTIDWDHFDIGENASAHFTYTDDGNSDWIVLNRVIPRDASSAGVSPSQILGQLTSDQRIYIINRNGILFGANSQVNVHSLTASALNINPSDLYMGKFEYKNQWDKETYQWGSGGEVESGENYEGYVINLGAIEAATEGSILLIGKDVANQGTIEAPLGQIGLIAGEEATLGTRSTSRAAYAVSIGENPGSALNEGSLVAAGGTVGMYGGIVNHQGVIRAVTAVSRQGVIELLGSEQVSTGDDSITASPITDSTENITNSSDFTAGRIDIGGWKPEQGSLSDALADSPAIVEIGGVVYAPSGDVRVRAREEIVVREGATLDVGGNDVIASGDSRFITMQWNSSELRDEYQQKDGSLKGETITFLTRDGSTIGVTEDAIGVSTSIAAERSVTGGNVLFESGGTVNIMQDSVVDFSGGVTQYSTGTGSTTRLVSGNSIFSVSDSPDNMTYSAIATYNEVVFAKYGVQETFEGLNYGGAAPLMDYIGTYVEGADAGSFEIQAKKLVLQGELIGNATAGVFQTLEEEETEELWDGVSYVVSNGKRRPRGGTLEIASSESIEDLGLSRIYIGDSAGDDDAGAGLAGDSLDLQSDTSYISPDTINNAGLRQLTLYANDEVAIGADAEIRLESGGTLDIASRDVTVEGRIAVPSAQAITINTMDIQTVSPGYTPKGGFFLASGAEINAAGERIDNSAVSEDGNPQTGLLDGGNITITDSSFEGGKTVIEEGARLIVDGGYEIGQDGEITGGDAGSITIVAKDLDLAGEVSGMSLLGQAGGTISLQYGGKIRISSELESSELDDGLTDDPGELVITPEFFTDGGFRSIEVRAADELVLESGVDFSVSTRKLLVSDQEVDSEVAEYRAADEEYEYVGKSGDLDVIELPLALIADSNISLSAGASRSREGGNNSSEVINADASLHIQEGSVIRVGNEGTVNAGARGSVLFDGTIDAPGGTVGFSAGTGSENLDGVDSVIISDSARIDVSGALLASTSEVEGYSAYEAIGGGDVSISAQDGKIVMAPGAVIDVSGSDVAENRYAGKDYVIETYEVVEGAGSVELSSTHGVEINGTLLGLSQGGLLGGEITVRKTGGTGVLELGMTDLNKYISGGFDDYQFEATSEIAFIGGVDFNVNGDVVLNTPLISVDNSESKVVIQAFYGLLKNSSSHGITVTIGQLAEIAPGTSEFQLNTSFMDIEGSVAFSDFNHIYLKSESDVRLQDVKYGTEWVGSVLTAGSMHIQAGRIYPKETAVEFTLETASTSPEGITISSTGEASASPVLSVGGVLTVKAPQIVHSGNILVPLGTVRFEGDTVELKEGGVTSTKGDYAVALGDVDEDGLWVYTDRNGDQHEIEAAPEKSIEFSASDLTIEEGAVLDISGGEGGIYYSKFLPGVEGSADPLNKDGRYVILPVDSPFLPDTNVVYLDESPGITAGYYALLDKSYAVVPGALIIEEVGDASVAGTQSVTSEGYAVVTGYHAGQWKRLEQNQQKVFSIRTVEDVLEEGNYTLMEYQGGEGGILSIDATRAVLSGDIQAAALDGYDAGTLSISGASIEVGLAQAVSDSIFVHTDLVSGFGFDRIELGNIESGSAVEGLTTDISILAGGKIEARFVELRAVDQIHMSSDSEITASGENGGISFEIGDGGMVTTEEGSILHASSFIDFAGDQLALAGGILVDDGYLAFTSSVISLGPDGYVQSGDLVGAAVSGLYLDETTLADYAAVADLILTAEEGIHFLGDIDVDLGGAISIDAGGLFWEGGLDGSVSIAADSVSLSNHSAVVSFDPGNMGNTFHLTGRSGVEVGSGDVSIQGFMNTVLESNNDIVLVGKGSLEVGDADTGVDGNLRLIGSRLVTRGEFVENIEDDADETSQYMLLTADFSLLAERGNISVEPSAANSGINTAELTPGGRLSIRAGQVSNAGVIQLIGGRLTITASGQDGEGIGIKNSGKLLVSGDDVRYILTGEHSIDFQADGGLIELTAEDGDISLQAGSELDASSPNAGGIIDLTASGDVILDGTISAHGGDGESGGELIITAGEVSGWTSDGKVRLSHLEELAESGGFTERLELRLRQGDLLLAAEHGLRARNIVLTADSGSLDIYGSLDASGSEGGGNILLAARNVLGVRSGSSLSARAQEAGFDGGEIFLNVASGGEIIMEGGSTIDLSSGGGEDARGGVLYRRFPGNPSTGEMAISTGSGGGQARVIGAREVIDEAYIVAIDQTGTLTLDSTRLRQLESSLEDYTEALRNNGSRDILLAGLEFAESPDYEYHLRPGLTVKSSADIKLTYNWDLGDWRYDLGEVDEYGTPIEEPGILTLAAEGNLQISRNLWDSQTDIFTLTQDPTESISWAYRLVAGADTSSADPLAVINQGNIKIDDYVYIYTESSPIYFAAGGDVDIGKVRFNYLAPTNALGYDAVGLYSIYSIATFNSDIVGIVGGNLEITGGIIESSMGDIDLEVGGDLLLSLPLGGSELGTIRTIGRFGEDLDDYDYNTWESQDYIDGGSIALNVGGSILSESFNGDYWIASNPDRTYIGADYSADYSTRGIATMAGGDIYIRSGGKVAAQVGVFKGGDAEIEALDDVDVHLLISGGTGTIQTYGNFGITEDADASFELMSFSETTSESIDLTALGSIEIDGVVNPTLVSDDVGRLNNKIFWWYTYSDESMVKLTSSLGDVVYKGVYDFYKTLGRTSILPPGLQIYSGRDIQIDKTIHLGPASGSNLQIIAKGDLVSGAKVTGPRLVFMSDAATEYIHTRYTGQSVNAVENDFQSPYFHGDSEGSVLSPLHDPDEASIEISAGGEIRNFLFALPKEYHITAGGDLYEVSVIGQNTGTGESSSIEARGDLTFIDSFSSGTTSGYERGIIHGGPGYLIIAAANSINLGNSTGIVTIGDAKNYSLLDEGSDILVIAGYSLDTGYEEAAAFMAELKDRGKEYSELLASGDTEEAEAQVEDTRQELINEFLGSASGDGLITMVDSKIRTEFGDDDILIIAAGDADIGRSAFFSDVDEIKNTGIATMAGGEISIFTEGDVDVNEARVMTFYGGDILIWSNHGDINAGRGSKAAVSSDTPSVTWREGVPYLVFNPPAVGSGVRDLTFDPDGYEGPKIAPEIGDLYLFAPEGSIDAGEAGIAGRNVFLGATEILNVENIEVAGTSVGVPLGVGEGAAVGALVGASGGIAETAGSIAKEVSERAQREASQLAESVVGGVSPKWLKVDVVGFYAQ